MGGGGGQLGTKVVISALGMLALYMRFNGTGIWGGETLWLLRGQPCYNYNYLSSQEEEESEVSMLAELTLLMEELAQQVATFLADTGGDRFCSDKTNISK